MIARVWRGWTMQANADAYEAGVRAHAPKIAQSQGFCSMHLLRNDGEHECEFVTVTCFATMDDVRSFAGAAYTRAVIPEALRSVITRVEPEVRHYTVPVIQSVLAGK